MKEFILDDPRYQPEWLYFSEESLPVDDRGEIVLNYRCKPVDGLRYIGVEIEIEAFPDADHAAIQAAPERLSIDYVWKEDGSLEDGAELVTYPATYAYLREQPITSMLRVMAKHGAVANRRCGLHVHITRDSSKDLTRSLRMLVYNNVYIKCLARFISRRNLCDLDRWASLDSAWFRYRHTAVNVCDNTYEFRIFAGTLNPDDFWASVQFALCLCEYAEIVRDNPPLDTAEGLIDYINASDYSELRAAVARYLTILSCNKSDTPSSTITDFACDDAPLFLTTEVLQCV